jgi:hypothetical protein
LAEAVGEALLLPMVVLRYEEVIGSFLGETASLLARVFEFAPAGGLLVGTAVRSPSHR